MKGKHITLQVPEPCHENWDAMAPNERGRFCNACSKTVVDFTQHSEDELIHFFKDFKGSLCGRYTDDQLNRPMLLPPEPRFHPVFKWVAGFFLFLTGSMPRARAQSPVLVGDTIAYQEPIKGKIAFQSGLRGRVTDEHHRPLAGVAVSCKNSGDTVLTDMYGGYILPYFAFQNMDRVVLEFQRQYYSKAEYQSLYTDLPSYIELSLTEIPFEQLQMLINNDSLAGDSAHPIMMNKIIINLAPLGVEVRATSGVLVVRREESEIIRRRRPPIDLMSNTYIID